MERLFLLSGASRREAVLNDWFKARPGILGALARQWFDSLPQPTAGRGSGHGGLEHPGAALHTGRVGRGTGAGSRIAG